MSGWIRVAPLHALGPGDVRTVRLTPHVSGRPREALVLHDRDGALRAYLNLCKHLPIPLDGGSRVFFDPERRHLRCGTHGALYRLEDGLCVDGPCTGRALTSLQVRVEDGWVELLDEPE